jgi:signal transduction histidine kinase/BarA-like signal transduction histidine kinase
MTNAVVLNVDDYLPGRYARSRVLRDAGFTVLEAASGGEALRLVQAQRPDVIILDQNLPDITGIEVCRRIKGDPNTEAIPVLQISATARTLETKVQAMNVGADTYLTEPLAPAELVAHVRAALRWRRAEERLRESNARMAALYEEAQRANKAKDDFLAVLSHELRTPLNAMLGWIQLLRGGKLEAAQKTQAVEIIERNANAQARLIEDLLDVSRIVSGQMTVRAQPVDLVPIVREALQTVGPAASARALSLEADIGPEGAMVMGDRSRLQQITVNLLSNAIKFSERGTIVITVKRQDERVIVEVRDSGVGIEPAFLPFVFDRFRQADSSKARTHGGLGLGLAITRHLVEAHGGHIAASSAGRGLGATFTVELPLASVEAAGRQAHAVAGGVDRERPLAGLHLLLVEDDADSREMMTLLLEQSGARVTAVGDPIVALEQLDQGQMDVMVADVGLPKMDGYALVRKMREKGIMTPAVALTGYASSSDRAQALEAGFNDHLGKPVAPEALVEILTTVTRQ